MAQYTDPVGESGKLGGSLSLVDVIAQSVGVMGPVFCIAFLVPLLVGLNASGSGAGAAAPLSVVISAVGVLGLGWIVSQYAKRIQATGSLYNYVTDGLGVRTGAAAGVLYYSGVLVLGAGILVMIGGTVHDTIAAEFGITPLPESAWDMILLAGLAIVLYLGVMLSSRVQLVLAFLSITVVLAFCVVVIIKVGAGNHVARAFMASSSPQGIGGVFFGVLYGVLFFTGFETAANLGEETAHPKRDVPRAVLISVLAVAGFYILGAYTQIAGYRFDLGALERNAGAPLFGLAGPVTDGGYGSVALRRLVELVVVLNMLAVLIGCSVSASRGLYAMARDRWLPAGLGVVGRRGTPTGASVTVLLVNFGVILLTIGWPGLFAQGSVPHYVAMFSWGSVFGGFALAIIYLLVSVGALRGLRDHPRRWAVYVACTLSVGMTGAALFGAIYKVVPPLSYAPFAAVLMFAVGIVMSFTRDGEPAVAQPQSLELDPNAAADYRAVFGRTP